jgi:hypothetical protein
MKGMRLISGSAEGVRLRKFTADSFSGECGSSDGQIAH